MGFVSIPFVCSSMSYRSSILGANYFMNLETGQLKTLDPDPEGELTLDPESGGAIASLFL